MSQKNVELVSEADAARNRGEMDEVLRLVAPDVVVDVTRRLLDPATFTGHDGLKAFIASLEEAWSEQQTQVERWVDAGEQVVALVHLRSTGRSSGVVIEAHPAWVYAIRDGKIARMTVYQTSPLRVPARLMVRDVLAHEAVEVDGAGVIDGRIAEHWVVRDDLGMMLQLGALAAGA